jgi:DNA repair photolyase
MITAVEHNTNPTYFKGRGSQLNTHNHFAKYQYVQEYKEVLDEEFQLTEKTEIIYTYPKTIINKVKSMDVGMEHSANPYQGCEHGCVYCYARPTHEYWGYSAGLDFEQKIIVKKNAVELLEKELMAKKWEVSPVVLSGNTDCYQPIEKKMEITRGMLKVFLKHKHPVSIITKNALILRDLDILKELAQDNLVHVMVSITGLDDSVRQKLEPRTSTYKNRLRVIQTLTENGIPCGMMMAPIIAGINNHDIPELMRLAGLAGARSAHYTIVRLNGAVGPVFKDWLFKNFPDRANKVWNLICDSHGGNPNDSRLGVRMRGEGKFVESINQMFNISRNRFITNTQPFQFNYSLFKKNMEEVTTQMSLFD